MVEGYQGGMIMRTDESIYDKLRVKKFGYDKQMRTEAYAVECTGKARDSRKSRRMGKLMCRDRSITTKRAQKTGDDSKRNDTDSRDTQTEEESKGGVKRPDGKIIRIRRTTTGKDSTADKDDHQGKRNKSDRDQAIINDRTKRQGTSDKREKCMNEDRTTKPGTEA